VILQRRANYHFLVTVLLDPPVALAKSPSR
jgi:hypothetical protein